MTWLWCYLSFNAGLLVGIVVEVLLLRGKDK